MRNQEKVEKLVVLLILVLIFIWFLYYKILKNQNDDLDAPSQTTQVEQKAPQIEQKTTQNMQNLPNENLKNQNLQIDEIKNQKEQIRANKNGILSEVKFGFQTQNLVLSHSKKRLYAYDNNNDGIAVIDISNPQNLQILGIFHFLNLQQSRTYIDIKRAKTEDICLWSILLLGFIN